MVAKGWDGGNAELRTFKARANGTSGVAGFMLDVWGRHAHVKIGESCIDLVRNGASQARLTAAGCTPYRSKATIIAVVRECLGVVASGEYANSRAWGVMAK